MPTPLELLACLPLTALLVLCLATLVRWSRDDRRSARQAAVAAQGARPEAPTLWELVYVDDDGVLLFTVVRVLQLDEAHHRLVAWCTRSQAQRVFKLSKVIKATHLGTGQRVRLPRSVLLNPEAQSPRTLPLIA